ncbi:MAG: methyltransferase domain-containing protein, partial [Chloroflexi bacterium]|nr:methyltransferase domain-containing protein [Chloroflexota bacterium]
MPWNPERYEQFKQERAAPFEDLLAMIDVREGMSVIDLGCGPGPLTKRLAGELPGSDVLGIDSSAEMLEQAAELARPGLRFEQREIENIDGEWDLVFTHAAIQWLPGHASLIPRLLSLVRPGGQLAVQLP